MQWVLVVFGWVFTVVGLLCILVPYLRRTADLLTTWNLFLLGSVNFIGISAIQSGMAYGGLYSIHNDPDYVKFVLGAIVFYLVAGLTYCFFGWPRGLASRRLKKWTRQDVPNLLWLMALALLLVIGYVLVPNVQFLGQLLINLGINASILAVVFAFGAWYMRPWNTMLLAILIACAIFALVVTISTGFGRRNLLSAVLSIPICLYWIRLRYLPARRVFVPLGIAAVVATVWIGGYSAIRAANADPDKGMLGAALERLKAIPLAFFERGDSTSLIGGDTTEASLTAINYYASQGTIQPFHTVIYVFTNPIPRAWFSGKVGSLGEALPRETGWVTRYGYVSWGVGIVGHGYFEGGLHMLAFYGFVIAAALRFWDELLKRQSTNLVLLGIFGACSAQVFALPRGEVGLFIVLILGAWVTGLLLSFVGRLLFGSVVYDAPAEQVLPSDARYEGERPVGMDGSGRYVNY